MVTPAPNQNEPSKLKKIMNSPQDESIMARLPRGNGATPPPPPAQPEPALQTPPPVAPVPVIEPVVEKPARWRWKFLPAFWTIASVMSFTVNIVLLIVVLILLQNRAPVSTLANDQVTGLLGGLYDNFVMMDQATINKQIVVDANIPLDIIVPVNLTNKEITLATDTVISRAHVEIYQGGVNINAPAKVTLPAGTKLNVDLSFDLPVQNTIPVHLEVPVSIPLKETELHQPFVGLQEVVKPWYCMTQPNAIAPDGLRVCDGVPNPLAPVFNLLPNE
jgi:hypothetical protein